jgi:hypothetical protein
MKKETAITCVCASAMTLANWPDVPLYTTAPLGDTPGAIMGPIVAGTSATSQFYDWTGDVAIATYPMPAPPRGGQADRG